MTKITEKDLNGILWNNFSIQESTTDDYILVLICDSRDQSKKLMELLKNNAFALEITINKQNQYILKLAFIESEYAITYNTETTKKEYPLLEFLEKSLVGYISTGIWLSNGYLECRPDVHPLSRIILN